MQPNVVYVPHRRDNHRDHRITHDLVVEACQWAGSPRSQECGPTLWCVDTIMCYEVSTPLQEVNYVEDITPFIDQKVKALSFHKSQLDNLAYDDAVRGLNRFRGVTTGKGYYCECFKLIKSSTIA